jgi:hypothetical protein
MSCNTLLLSAPGIDASMSFSAFRSLEIVQQSIQLLEPLLAKRLLEVLANCVGGGKSA